ncbi:hypothetical protein [Cryptosporangium aurantiacum]|uniref:Uncharacterized protein n=1 Tax=Cryptosporangium aurantiacum TaxID=134849 RepID=A0A1M7RNG5_9ACTN|nr:hypothetical protein [Cryptosporangium aurantiacum]SHN47887.1 hypothetical protein SAMN05443668_12947 [Cryptosporangium aurantiacum]
MPKPPLPPPDPRLAVLRGGTPPKRHNARTIAALTTNPGCVRRAVLDTAGIDKDALARHLGFPAPFGQSSFAITRGNSFEAQVKADGCAELLTLLRDTLDLDLTEVAYTDLESVGDNTSEDVRNVYSEQQLAHAAGQGGGTLFDHPLLRLIVAGQSVYLEPDLVAFQHDGVFHIVEIKSFAVIDGQADPGKVAAAAIQSAVYVHALRHLLGRPEAVADEVVLVCPKDFSNRPVATKVDVRKQLIVLNHQLTRLENVDSLLNELPSGLSLGLDPDADGRPTRPVKELTATLDEMHARYAPDCLGHCELGFYCREEAAGYTDALGTAVREQLGGVDTVAEALALADGSWTGADHQAEVAAALRTTARVWTETRATGSGAA